MKKINVLVGALFFIVCCWTECTSHRKGGHGKFASCGKDKFNCRTGNLCIPLSSVCDGNVDCPGGTDENTSWCSLVRQKCEPNMYTCDSGNCINQEKVCDGKIDCYNGTDERNCTKREGTICGENEMLCQNGQCVAQYQICDGQKDCSDGSDETAATCSSISCPPYVFRCLYGACVDSDAQCNGISDCADGSDEQNCG